MAFVIFFGPLFLSIFLWLRYRKLKKHNEALEAEAEKTRSEAKITLAKAESIRKLAQEQDAEIHRQKQKIISDAQKDAENILTSAREEANRIVTLAKEEALKITSDTNKAMMDAVSYRNTVTAMKNIIEGYGNEYIMPSHLLLDDLANTYGYTQAGEDFKKARAYSKGMIKSGSAAECDYVEASRTNNAINFVIDAFNGKVDSILARVKIDNFGKLKQEMTDAYNLVNFNGQAFRNARITEDYFKARLEELRLACVIHKIRQRDIEEQRQIRDQIREEEKARREIEKALRDSAKQEEILQKAMEKARAQLEQATAEQRDAYEAQIAELKKKWQEAEERNKRAKSMAQQTKCGYVYIISNIGSFGENIYKIGMTRRLEPLDRIRELSSASVPFNFDVHAMIWSEDAPALESQLHRKFALAQVNKVNYRKEYFRIPLSDIRAELEKDNLEIKWTMAAEANEYRETLAIEKSIAEDPQAREAWLNRQFELEMSAPVSLYEDTQGTDQPDISTDLED